MKLFQQKQPDLEPKIKKRKHSRMSPSLIMITITVAPSPTDHTLPFPSANPCLLYKCVLIPRSYFISLFPSYYSWCPSQNWYESCKHIDASTFEKLDDQDFMEMITLSKKSMLKFAKVAMATASHNNRINRCQHYHC